VLNKTITTGEMIAILQMTTLLVQTSVLVALTNIQIQEAKVAADRMFEFSSAEPEYDVSALTAEPGYPLAAIKTLRVENISFRFPGKKQLLRDISFELNIGEIVALTGESGQGKSTIFQILQKFYQNEQGEVFVNGRRLSEVNSVTWRKKLGVVQQDIMIFSGSLAANICVSDSETDIGKVESFCKNFGFDKYFSQFPQGYHTVLGEGGVALSGGQKQLMALARSLYSSPSLLLLDEPTSAMDAYTERFVINLLRSLKERLGILIISHKDSLTQLADKIYSIHSGLSCKVSENNTVEVL
jgi:ATP-binding cassette subfamily B protein